jgi:hypothetical protein
VDCFENLEGEIISAVRVLEVNSEIHIRIGRQNFHSAGTAARRPFVTSNNKKVKS